MHSYDDYMHLTHRYFVLRCYCSNFCKIQKPDNEKLQYINAIMNAIFDCSQTLVLVTCENIKDNLTPGVIRSKYKIQF